jgi:hypothetical protein
MTLDDWFTAAVEDAKRRGLPELEPLLKGLRAATVKLRAADFVDDASGAAAAPRTRTPGTRA